MRKAAVVAFVLMASPVAAEPQWFPSLDNRIFRSGTVDLRATYAAYSDRSPTGREDDANGGYAGDGGDGPGGLHGSNPRTLYAAGPYAVLQGMLQRLSGSGGGSSGAMSGGASCGCSVGPGGTIGSI